VAARRVDGVARELLAPLLANGLDGWRAIGWDAEQGISLTVERAGVALLVELAPRDDGLPAFARTARFNVQARRVASREPLDEEARRFVAAFAALVGLRESRLPPLDGKTDESADDRVAVREILVERALIPERAGAYYFNPYAGCLIGCAYCYVAERAALSRALDGAPPARWGRFVDVKVNAPEVLRDETARLPPGPVRMSPILTDPYQPIERRYRITRRSLEVLLDAGFAPVVLTRAARLVEDLALLRRFPRAAVGFSIPTDDDEVRRAFEPGADPVEDRFAALAECARAGVRTFAVVQPILPMNVARLVDKIAPFVSAVRIDRMHEMRKALPLYQAAGRLDAARDSFFVETESALREAFSRRGIPVDESDDLGALVSSSR